MSKYSSNSSIRRKGGGSKRHTEDFSNQEEQDFSLCYNLVIRFPKMHGHMRHTLLLQLLRQCDPTDMSYLYFILPNLHRDFLSRLPVPLAHHILTYTEPIDLCTVATICKEWLNLVKHPDLWQLLYTNLGLKTMALQNYSPQLSLGSNTRRLHIIGNWVRGCFQQQSFTAHELGILAMAFVGNIVVTGSIDKTIKMWDVANGALIKTLVGHSEAVYCLQYDGIKILSGSADHTIRLWSVQSGSELFVLNEHSGTVTCLKQHHTMIISGSSDTTLRIWVSQNGKEYNPNYPKTLGTPICTRILYGHTAAIKALDFFQDLLVSGSVDGTIRLWHISSGNGIRVIRPESIMASPGTPLNNWDEKSTSAVSCIQLSTEALVFGTYHGLVYFYAMQPCPSASHESIKGQGGGVSYESMLSWATKETSITLRKIYNTDDPLDTYYEPEPKRRSSVISSVSTQDGKTTKSSLSRFSVCSSGTSTPRRGGKKAKRIPSKEPEAIISGLSIENAAINNKIISKALNNEGHNKKSKAVRKKKIISNQDLQQGDRSKSSSTQSIPGAISHSDLDLESSKAKEEHSEVGGEPHLHQHHPHHPHHIPPRALHESTAPNPISKQWVLTLKMDAWRIICGRKDGKVVVWNLHTQRKLTELHAETKEDINDIILGRNRNKKARTAVTGVQFDDKYIVAGGMDGQVKVWEVEV